MEILYLTVDQVVELHDQALALDGGRSGINSLHALASAVNQPMQSAFGEDAYKTIAEKAAALAFSLIMGHPFVDGNKRTGALALEAFLDVNGYELRQTDDEFESIVVDLASGVVDQGEFFGWVVNHARPTNLLKMPAVNN